MVAPLGTDGGIVGAMVVTNRLGDVTTFTAEDLRLYATVASHAGRPGERAAGAIADQAVRAAGRAEAPGIP